MVEKGTESFKKLSKESADLQIEYKKLTAETTKLVQEEMKQTREADKSAAKFKERLAQTQIEVKTNEDLRLKLQGLRYVRERLDRTTEEGLVKYRQMTTEIQQLSKSYDDNNASMGVFTQRVGNYQQAVDTANMSMREMQLELRQLQKQDLSGLDPKQIQLLETRMGALTDTIDKQNQRYLNGK